MAVQVVAWLVAWPLVGAVALLGGERVGVVRGLAAAGLVLLALPLWVYLLVGDLGAEPAPTPGQAATTPGDPATPDPVTPTAPVTPGGTTSTGTPAGSGPSTDTDGELWTVVVVVDGDTIRARSSSGVTERVRLIGIDTPERDECGFEEATAAMSRLVLDRRVTLVAGARDDRDRHGRLVRYVDVDGTDAGLELIRTGLAVARYDSRDGHGRHAREDVYLAADAASRHLCAA